MLRGTKVLWLGALMSVLGCKAEDEPQPLADIAAFEAAVADLSCQSLAACCEREGVAIDAERCRAGITVELAWGLGPESASATYDPELAAACLAAAKPRTTCGRIDDGSRTLEVCEHVLHGTLPPGAPCETFDDCEVGPGQSVSCTSDRDADGDEVKGGSVCVVFTHQPAEHGKLGDDCRMTCVGDCFVSSSPNPARFAVHGGNVGCYRDDGLRCGSEGRCAELVNLGEECISDDECVAGAFCGGGRLPGVCTVLFENGEDCFAAPLGCKSGYCDQETWRCSERAFDIGECMD